MSAQGRSLGRIENDSYETPVDAITPLLEIVPLPRPLLDPCCGSGEILRVLHQHGYGRWTYGVELVEEKALVASKRLADSDILCNDFLETEVDDWDGPINCVFTNPPYNLLDEFWLQAMDILQPGGRILFLLRINVIGRVTGSLFNKGSGYKGMYGVRPRPSFGKKYRCPGDKGSRCDHVEWRDRKSKIIPVHANTGCTYSGDVMELSSSTDATEYAWYEWEKGHRNDGRNSFFVRLPLPKGHSRRRR